MVFNGVDILDKSELVKGRSYKGDCRNASEAVWNGRLFVYKRTKFGDTYDETIEHPEDDCGYDLFLPRRDLN
jgi:hypothetical protein